MNKIKIYFFLLGIYIHQKSAISDNLSQGKKLKIN